MSDDYIKREDAIEKCMTIQGEGLRGQEDRCAVIIAGFMEGMDNE